MTPRASVFVLLAALLALPLTAAAQGKGNGNGQGRPKGPTKSPTSPTSSPASSSPAGTAAPTTSGAPPSDVAMPVDLAPPAASEALTFRQFGSWLDDAGVTAKGECFVSVMAGHWRLADAAQTNIPMIAAGVAVSDRVQVSASVPFYRVSYQGSTSGGVDDVYLSGKVMVVDPTLTLSEIGVAVSPVVEILSTGAGSDRLHFAIPVSVEVRRYPLRVYLSGGYFSRGSLFAAGAVEWSRGLTTVSGSLSQSHSTHIAPALDALGVSSRRLDVSGSASRALGRSAAISMTVGRSLSSIEQGGTRLSLIGGMTFRFSAPRPAP